MTTVFFPSIPVESMRQMLLWIRENLFSAVGIGQLAVIAATYAAARSLAVRFHRYLFRGGSGTEKHFWKTQDKPIAILFGYIVWVLALWFSRVLSGRLGLPEDVFRLAMLLALGAMVVHVGMRLSHSVFWSRTILLSGLVVILLGLFNLWGPTIRLLDSMQVNLGPISFTVWRLIVFTVIFGVLGVLSTEAISYLFSRSKRLAELNVSDRLLLERLCKPLAFFIVILFSLNAAGIRVTALAVTGGAIGVAAGVGLQKIFSNLVCGLHLLISKPVRPGDIIALKESINGAIHGTITQMSLTDVHIVTSDGTEQLIPNEQFLLNKIENLSFTDTKFRIRVPIGISYTADVEKAKMIAVSAAMGIDRVLKVPGPQCRFTGFGDSSVDMILLFWIDDPKNGLINIRDAVLSAVWKAFHEGEVEIPFPQRDLHIRDAVTLHVVGDRSEL